MRGFWAALALSILAGVAGAQAQTYPSRPVTLVVPFPPGGSTDAAARIMAERMRVTLGQAVVIENVGGAGGSIGVGRVARAAPDGYTFDIGQWDTHVGSIIYKLDYDLEKDFEPIPLISGILFLIVLVRGQMAPRGEAGAYRFAIPVHMPARIPAALNSFGLWLALMIGLTVVNYGYPIAQLMTLPQTNVPAVYVGA